MQLRVQRRLALLWWPSPLSTAWRHCSSSSSDHSTTTTSAAATAATDAAVVVAATSAVDVAMPPRPSPAATPGGVCYSEHVARELVELEQRRRHVPRATDAQRRGDAPTTAEMEVSGGVSDVHQQSNNNNNSDNNNNNNNKQSTLDEYARWWPRVRSHRGSGLHAPLYNVNKPLYDGMAVPELREVPSPHTPAELSFAHDSYFAPVCNVLLDEVHAREKQLPPPAPFDPALDDYDGSQSSSSNSSNKQNALPGVAGGVADRVGHGGGHDDEHYFDGYNDMRVLIDVQRAAEDDRRRLEAFGNPMTVDDEVEYLLATTRHGSGRGGGADEAVRQQRREFNGFAHWGLLHSAHMLLADELDTRRAHECVNRYVRDMDLFVHWLAHDAVRAHLRRKFGVDVTGKFDKVMALAMALYTRAKVQVYEDDAVGALKTLVQATALLSSAATTTRPRHRTMTGAVLLARGAVHCRLKAYANADDDLTRALAFVPASRASTLYQLRAEAREALGRLDEARADEERAAALWERADVVHPGMHGGPCKFVS